MEISQMGMPDWRQPQSHDIDALKWQMRDVVKRIGHDHRLAYSVSDIAPGSYADLKASSTSRLVVLGPYSNQTIFGDPCINHMFRAWHDTLHLELAAKTSLDGEFRLSFVQANEAARVCGDIIADFVFADLGGQALHYNAYGCFPVDQATFDLEFVKTGCISRH